MVTTNELPYVVNLMTVTTKISEHHSLEVVSIMADISSEILIV